MGQQEGQIKKPLGAALDELSKKVLGNVKGPIVELPDVGMKIQDKDEVFVNPCWVQGKIGTVIRVRDDSVIVEFENYTCPMWPEEYIILQEKTIDA